MIEPRPFRILLALYLAVWAPLGCCCAAEAADDGSPVATGAASSCCQASEAAGHASARAATSPDRAGPCRGPGECDCRARVADAMAQEATTHLAVTTEVVARLDLLRHAAVPATLEVPVTFAGRAPPGDRARAGESARTLLAQRTLLTI